MPCPKLSNSPRRQNVMRDIWSYLEDLGINEVKRYIAAFPRETDFNLVQYGNMRVYYSEIRDMYANAGYTDYHRTRKRTRNGHKTGDWYIPNDSVWNAYKADVRSAALAFVNQR